jgi:hypothetical protein
VHRAIIIIIIYPSTNQQNQFFIFDTGSFQSILQWSIEPSQAPDIKTKEEMSVPCDIREAVAILSSGKPISSSSSATPVDVLAVVVSIAQNSLAPPVASIGKIELYISDESLSADESAFVTLKGSDQLSRIEHEQISIGDVIRFNRLFLRSRPQSSNAFHFVHLNDNPEPGTEWFRFDSNKSSSNRIPENMVTSGERIQELKSWFQQSRKDSFLLAPLRCKQRSLSEIYTSVGLLSNVAVKVKHHECQRATTTSIHSRATKKRRIPQPTIGYAIVTDESSSDISMSLIDIENRFSVTLQKAKNSCLVLILSNVLTRKQSDVLGTKDCTSDEIILVPTKASVAIFLRRDYRRPSLKPLSPLDATQTQMPNPIKDEQITVVASILDISIGGKLLHESQCMKSPASFIRNILTTDKRYHDAILHLESFGISAIQYNHKVFASSDILKTLCGGIDAEDLINKETQGLQVFRLVKAMLREQVMFRWTIEKNFKSTKVLKVALPNN